LGRRSTVTETTSSSSLKAKCNSYLGFDPKNATVKQVTLGDIPKGLRKTKMIDGVEHFFCFERESYELETDVWVTLEQLLYLCPILMEVCRVRVKLTAPYDIYVVTDPNGRKTMFYKNRFVVMDRGYDYHYQGFPYALSGDKSLDLRGESQEDQDRFNSVLMGMSLLIEASGFATKRSSHLKRIEEATISTQSDDPSCKYAEVLAFLWVEDLKQAGEWESRWDIL